MQRICIENSTVCYMNPLRALRNAPFPSFAIDFIEQRYDPITGLRGMYCVGKHIPAETLVACIPLYACISPAIVLSTKAGQRIASALRKEGYVNHHGVGKMEFSFESMLVASFTALSMSRGPLKEYLANIATERDSERLMTQLRALGGQIAVDKYNDLQMASNNILEQVHQDIMGAANRQNAHATTIFSLEALRRSHALCESRVLSVPSDLSSEPDAGKETEEVDLLGGPALIPWFDLVNHSDKPSNIAAVVMKTDRLPTRMANIAPLCVVGATRREIKVGEEITYEYAEPLTNAKEVLDGQQYLKRLLLWATRFHFIPDHMQ